MFDSSQMEKTNIIAQEILHISRNDILFHLRFFDTAVSMLAVRPASTASITTNGDEIGYNPGFILNLYKRGGEYVTRAYLHIILHCIFKHPYVDSLVEHDYWNLACDITVENIINELNLNSMQGIHAKEQNEYIGKLKQEVNLLTAERIYRYFIDSNMSGSELKRLLGLFTQDDHSTWYLPPQSAQQAMQSSGDTGTNQGDVGSDSESGDGDCKDSGSGESSLKDLQCAKSPLSAPSSALSSEKWNNCSRRIKVDLDTFSRERGDGSGSMIQNLRVLTREKYDYSAFLKRFAVLGETMRINDEEFDYIYYTYGLKLYKKMPLIEPLEYKEVRRIKDFVIAIDTSGSVQGELVQMFVQKTYNILKSTESFFTKINLYIIQCDAEIQQVVKITSQDDFDKYLKDMSLMGFGGTDFRPVFSYVDQLRKDGELQKLKGLIYLTDGYGAFPETKPEYSAAFIFISDYYIEPKIPPWAIKLVLDNADIKKI